MPSHSKPVVTSTTIVSVSVNPHTLITIFGVNIHILRLHRETQRSTLFRQVSTSESKQKVQAELQDGNSDVQSSASFDGVQRESLYLEDDSTKKAIVWGPFDAQMTVTLSLCYQDSGTDDWKPSIVNVHKMKEASCTFYCVKTLQ